MRNVMQNITFCNQKLSRSPPIPEQTTNTARSSDIVGQRWQLSIERTGVNIVTVDG